MVKCLCHPSIGRAVTMLSKTLRMRDAVPGVLQLRGMSNSLNEVVLESCGKTISSIALKKAYDSGTCLRKERGEDLEPAP